MRLQQPSVKPLAAKLKGRPYNPNSKAEFRHANDAMLHVEWYYHLKRSGRA